jgi:hypothetical protein
MKHIVFSGVLTCWLVIGMAACAAPRNVGMARETTLTTAVLNTGRHCASAPEGWKATWISSHRALRAKIAQCGANRIGAADNVPEIDYTRHGVLVVEMGNRRTGGYGFDTEKVTVQVTGRTATVKLGIYQPAPGAPVTQALTAPWVMIQMPLGEYRSIRVVNQNALLLTEIELP